MLVDLRQFCAEKLAVKRNAIFGFAARRVNGNSITEILAAFEEAKSITDKPYVMVCETRLFEGIIA